MTLPRPREIRGKIDENDLAYVRSLGVDAVLAEPCPFGGKGKINPHVTRFHHKDGKITDVFHIKPVYYETIDHLWRPMSEVTTHHGNKMIVLKQDWSQKMSLRYFKWLMNRQRLFKNRELMIDGYVLQPRHMVFATDATFYPDAHTETTTVDGYLQSGSTTSWAACRGKTDADTIEDSVTVVTQQGEKVSGWWYCNRHAFLFNTASLTSGATISSATFSLFKRNTADGNLSETTYPANLSIVSSNPASNTALVAGDFDSFGTTKFATDITISTFENNRNVYHNFGLNASGLSAISKTGVTKLGIRPSNDFSDSTSPSLRNYSYGFFSEEVTAGTDPKLAVTYSSATNTSRGMFALVEKA